MNQELRRRLLGTTGRSVFYASLGTALFCGVLWAAWLGVAGEFVREPEFVKLAPEQPRPATPDRHVPPMELTFPFY